jgi:transposase
VQKKGAKIDSVGYDAGKKVKGKKRHTAVDTIGLLINIVVTPGDVQDRHIIAPLLAIARERFPSLKRAIADGGYQGKLTADEVQQQAGIPLEIVKRSDIAKGFYILPKRWIVERTYGWLGRWRRIVKDYENLTRSHIGFIILAMIRLMLRRIVRLATSR